MPYYYYPTRYGYGGSGLLLVLICAVFALWASHNVNSTFKKYAQQYSRRRITGARPPSGCSAPTASTASGSSGWPAI